MKTLQRSKMVIASSVIAVLSGCGSDSYTPPVKENLYAPEHGGNIVVNLHESDSYVLLSAIGGVDGRLGTEGTAIDMDGDVLVVRNGTISPADAVGVEPVGPNVGVRPQDIAAEIDTGEVYSVVLSFEISDSVHSIPRTMTINIVGEDSAPEFDDPLVEIFTKFDPISTVDLLNGVVDADGEELTITGITPDPDNLPGAATIEGNFVHVDIPSFSDQIELGRKEILTFTYKVEDHNHSLDRTAHIEVRGVTQEPLPPIVTGPQTIAANMSGLRTVVDLGAEPAVLEPNGEAVVADLSTFSPVGDAPAFKFPSSMDNNLIFDPIIFAAHVDSGETKTFTYTYMVNDGDIAHNVEASVEITITNDGAENVMVNGGFEEGLSGWTPAGIGLVSAVTSSGLGLDFEGNQLAAFTAEETLSTNLDDLELGATYVLESRAKHAGGWDGGSTATIKGTVVEMDSDGNVSLSPNTKVTSNNWYEHGAGNRTSAVSFTALEGMSVDVKVAQAVETDDFRLFKHAFEQANNLISEADSTFDTGAANWTLADGATVSEVDAITGGMSLHSGKMGDKRNILVLADGTLEDGKRYLVTIDVEVDGEFIGNHPLRVSVVDPDNNDVTVIGHAFKGVYFLNDAKQTFTAVLDLPRDSGVNDWSTRPQEFHIGTNVWGQGFNYRIDNVRIVEIP